MIPAKAKRTVAALIVILACVTFVAINLPNEEPETIRLPDGKIVRLEGYHFSTNTIRYDLPNRPWVTRIEKIVPASIKRKIRWPRPTATMTAGPIYPGEPVLSAAFSVRAPGSDISCLRLIVADDREQEFDPAVQYTSVPNGCWATAVAAFPRRGNKLRLRLMRDNTKMLAEFKIPNPAPGPYPKWKALPLPVTARDAGLEVSLIHFRTFQPGSATFMREGVYPRSQCVFRVKENGVESFGWQSTLLEVRDATGNHWRPPLDGRQREFEQGTVCVTCLGALWPEEDAWKLRVEFRRTSGFPDHELVELAGIRIPKAKEFLEPHVACETNSATLEVATVSGYPLNPELLPGCVMVLIKGRIMSHDKSIKFVRATDDKGRDLKLEGPLPSELRVQGLDYLPYPLKLRVSEDARELKVVMAVTERTFLEFLAKPEQIREDR